MFLAFERAAARWRIASLATAFTALTPTASAQPAETPAHQARGAKDAETARSLVGLGYQRLKEDDRQGALEAFATAHTIMGVPTTGLLVGRTQAAMGMLLQARDTLLHVSRIPAEPDEPAPFAKAREEASQLARDVMARIPSLRVKVTTASGRLPPGEPTVVIDHVALSGATAGLPRNVNPGEHEVRAEAPGYAPRSVHVSVEEGEQRLVAIELAPLAPARPAPAPIPPPQLEASDDSGVALGVAFAGFGTAGAGLAVGAITGVLSLSAAADAKALCPSLKHCPEAARAPHDRAIALANASNVGFAIGGAGLAVGVVALVVHLVGGEATKHVAPTTEAGTLGAGVCF